MLKLGYACHRPTPLHSEDTIYQNQTFCQLQCKQTSSRRRGVRGEGPLHYREYGRAKAFNVKSRMIPGSRGVTAERIVLHERRRLALAPVCRAGLRGASPTQGNKIPCKLTLISMYGDSQFRHDSPGYVAARPVCIRAGHTPSYMHPC